ncbi:MAG: hypothetical protein ACKVQC_03095, partial [Elusimicrobiota bacterium]
IEIADDLNNPVYIMNVIPTGVGEKGRKRQSSFKDDLKFATTYNILLEFTEEVSSPTFKLGDIEAINLTPVGSSRNKWQGQLTTPPSSSNVSCTDKWKMFVTAFDDDNHFNLPGQSGYSTNAPLDQNPETIATRIGTEPYPWNGYETDLESQAEIPPPCPCSALGDLENPVVYITDIPNPSCLANTTLSVSGHVSDNCILQSLTIDNEPVSMTPNLSSTTFTKSIVLPEGPSQIDMNIF